MTIADPLEEEPVESVKVGHHVSLGRWESFIEVLVVANLIALAFETLPGLSAFWYDALWSFEVFCAAVYTVEYGVRLYLARPRWKYVTSFYGVIDLLAFLPFWLMAAFNLQAVRAFRLLRLLRLFKLVRYTHAVERFRRAFAIARDDLVLFGVIALIGLRHAQRHEARLINRHRQFVLAVQPVRHGPTGSSWPVISKAGVMRVTP